MQELTGDEIQTIFGGSDDDDGSTWPGGPLTGGTTGPYDPLPQLLQGL